MLAAAAALGLLIGVLIGTLGGGGGVLTVPALVYLLGQSAQDATTSSLIIVGVTAVAGVLARLRGGLVRWRSGVGLAAVGVPAALLGTALNQRTSEPVLLLAFSAVTLLAAAVMLVDSRGHDDGDGDDGDGDDGDDGDAPGSPPASAVAAPARVRAGTAAGAVAKVIACGLAVGVLTGFLGVGGGFLMVPALVIVLRIPMTQAIGTSLLVIALNAVAALAARAGTAVPDWRLIVPFTVAAIAGALVGKLVSDRVSGRSLTRAFAVLLLVVGGFVAVQSVLAL